jgi:4-methyl-5(b-hydroxyethyl)-thiazole monophosphate biosynthesis
MENKKILILLDNGFEEIEAVSPIDILRRAGGKVTVAAIGDKMAVKGKTGITLVADQLLSECRDKNFDALVLPGGPAAKSLRNNATVLDLVRSFAAKGLPIGAICAAPTILHEAGILAGKKYTAHFSVGEELTAILPDPVVQDGNLITSQGAATAVAFALALVSVLFGEEASNEIATSICVP